MSELLHEIEIRRAQRALNDLPIPQVVVDRIMLAATYAPSCSNKQPWRYIVVQSEEGRSKVQEALSSGNYWAKKAPVFILAFTSTELDCKLSDSRDYASFDLGLSVMNLLLQATKEGLIAHPMAGFDPVQLKGYFSIPSEYVLFAVIAVAYSGSTDGLSEKHRESEHSQRQRKPLHDVVFADTFSPPQGAA
ncbi:MAG TPA: nitroreductase family protein [Spirochaetia bacterium]|nr:nitroreductase family protein [Spirochaetia bacterium]